MPPPIRPIHNFTPAHIFATIIIGAGPAGLSAALALSRMNSTALLFNNGKFRNDRAHRAHSVLSRDHTPPNEIRRIAREQVDAYGTTHFVERSVITARKIQFDHGGKTRDGFEVTDSTGEKWRARTIVLATGVQDIFPTDLPGYDDCWGNSIWQCLFCDGIERQDRPAGLLGWKGAESLHLAQMVFTIGCKELTILTNGDELIKTDDRASMETLEIAKALGAEIDDRKIERFEQLDEDRKWEMIVHFHDGGSKQLGFLVHQPPTQVAASHLAKDLGVAIVPDGRGGTMLKRDEPFGATNVSGVYVAGDASAVMKQVTMGSMQGGLAGGGILFQLWKEQQDEVRQDIKLRDASGETEGADSAVLCEGSKA